MRDRIGDLAFYEKVWRGLKKLPRGDLKKLYMDIHFIEERARAVTLVTRRGVKVTKRGIKDK